MKRLFGFLLVLICFQSTAQDSTKTAFFKRPNRETRSGQFYFFWGYNRSAYTKSDIHVHGPEYEFTVYGAIAHDRPTPLGDEAYYNPTLITIPQFNFRLGYMINEKWSVSLGWDHMKYVMDQNQVAEVSGYINHPDYTLYNGTYLRQKMTLSEDFFKFEHTDGLNVTSLDVERRFHLVSNKRKTLGLYAFAGGGTGIVVPRSDVRVVTQGLNNNWHISGYHLNGTAGLRLEFLRNGFLQFANRSGYVNLPNVLIQNDSDHRIDHHFFFTEWYGSIGMYFKVF